MSTQVTIERQHMRSDSHNAKRVTLLCSLKESDRYPLADRFCCVYLCTTSLSEENLFTACSHMHVGITTTSKELSNPLGKKVSVFPHDGCHEKETPDGTFFIRR